MKMTHTQQQRGAVLFIALIILLMVSMMGVSAMRSGIFHERMAFNTQVEEMTFQAAETAVNGVIKQARTNEGNLLGRLVALNQVTTQCFSRSNGLSSGECTAGQFVDSRDAFQSQAESKFDLKRPSMGNDTEKLADYQFRSVGIGTAVNDDTVRRNLQEWRKIGPAGGPFEVPDQAAVGINVPAE